MPAVLRRTRDDDGNEIHDDDWHIGDPSSETPRILCTGEAVDGDSDVVLEEKEVKRGGITCENCKAIVKQFKAIKI